MPIFDPFDAQLDPEKREWQSFEPADPDTVHRFEAAMAHVNEMERPNLESWCGKGIRLIAV